MGRLQPRYMFQSFTIESGKLFPLFQEAGQPLELFNPYGRLHVGHSVVKSRRNIVFKNDLVRTMPDGIRHAHGMLAEQTELRIVLGVVCRDHSSVPGGNKLPRVKREAGDVPVRFTDSFPPIGDLDFTPYGTGGIFDHRQLKLIGNGQDGW